MSPGLYMYWYKCMLFVDICMWYHQQYSVSFPFSLSLSLSFFTFVMAWWKMHVKCLFNDPLLKNSFDLTWHIHSRSNTPRLATNKWKCVHTHTSTHTHTHTQTLSLFLSLSHTHTHVNACMHMDCWFLVSMQVVHLTLFFETWKTERFIYQNMHVEETKRRKSGQPWRTEQK